MKRFLLALALAGAFAACKKAEPAPLYEKIAVQRRDIVVSASAAGSIQPILTVDVKSKASGQIIEMRVETGDEVRPGQLLAKIDPRIPQANLEQAQAALEVANAQLANAKAQLARSDTLFKAQAITETDYESAKLAYAQANAQLVNARTNLQTAQDAMEDTQVRAPLKGTIIQKNVELGTVISSPTKDVGGGTVLLRMANLDTVQVSALVDETDVGKVQPGVPVTITVDAFPNRPFDGQVLKIEPQAQVNQNVTMFPVLVNILNPGHLLKPGTTTEEKSSPLYYDLKLRPNMTASLSFQIRAVSDVVRIPNAALRTQRDVASAAQVLGLDPEQVQQQLAAAQMGGGRPSQGDSTAPAGDGTKLHAAEAPKPGATDSGATFTTPSGRTIRLPKGVTPEQVRAAFQKRMSGAELTPAEQALLAQLRSQFQRPEGGGGARGAVRSRAFETNYIVFALRGGKPGPVAIRTGLTDQDYIEVVDGLKEQDTVLVLPSASLVQSQQDMRRRFQNVTGGGLPGLRQQSQSTTTPR